MWIDRIVTELPGGPEIVDLHQRLTVICSVDDRRRREAYERIVRALRVQPGTQVEIRSDYGDNVLAMRPHGQQPLLLDAQTQVPVHAEQRGLGIIAQVNDPGAMANHLEMLHVTPLSLQHRAHADSAQIDLAQRPLDQLWNLAGQLQSDRDRIRSALSKNDVLDAAARERESEEENVAELLAVRRETEQRAKTLFIGAAGLAVLGVISLVFVHMLLGLLMILAGAGVAVTGWYIGQEADELSGGHDESTQLGVQLGRVDELFDTVSVSRSRRSAEEALEQNERMWAELAGEGADPMLLLRERTRIEELAGHIRLISNEAVPADADPTLLLGFASLLAELSRRFPAERVPLVVDDLFAHVHPAYHGALRELVLRATHRRQVVLETADLDACAWAATEAIAGDALLITDQNVATAPQSTGTLA